jgi:hypothetical protein
MSFENTTAAFADPETGALARGLTMDAANLAKSRSEALAKYQSARRAKEEARVKYQSAKDVRDAALAAPDGNTPIEFIAENGNTVTLPASQILSLPRFQKKQFLLYKEGLWLLMKLLLLILLKWRLVPEQGNYSRIIFPI